MITTITMVFTIKLNIHNQRNTLSSLRISKDQRRKDGTTSLPLISMDGNISLPNVHDFV